MGPCSVWGGCLEKVVLALSGVALPAFEMLSARHSAAKGAAELTQVCSPSCFLFGNRLADFSSRHAIRRHGKIADKGLPPVKTPV